MARQTPVIIDDDDPQSSRGSREARDPSRDKLECGLASTLIGATFLIVAPMSLLMFLALLRPSFDGHPGRGENSQLELLAVLAAFGAEVLCIAGLLYGVRGVTISRLEKTTATLPVAGILLCLFGILVWLLIALVIFSRSATG